MAPPSRWRSALVAGAIALALVVAALAGGDPGSDGPPLDPRSDGPLGTSALVTLLQAFGADVDLSVGLPSAADDVALLLQDRLDDDQFDDVLAWVRAGGHLVVTDPGSLLLPPALPMGFADALDPAPLERGVCSIDALADVGSVAGGTAVRYETGGADGSCLGSRDFAFVITRAEGSGFVTGVGGAAFLTNDVLATRDNAVLAVALLAPERATSVRVVDAPLPAGGGDETLGDLVPDNVRRLLLQLAVAFVAYALWRAIRLGRPVPETQPVEVAGSELVRATGRLLGRGRAPGPAAEALRQGLRRRLRPRLGIAVEAPPSALAEVVVARSGLEPEVVEAALGEGPVTTDGELVAVARAVASVHQEVLR
jgi:hypothetical protein